MTVDPAAGAAGAALSAIARSAPVVTALSVTDAALFSGAGSGWSAAATCAVTVAVAACIVAMTVSTASPSTGTGPTLHRPVAASNAPPPLAETTASPAGSATCTATPVAACGPPLCTVTDNATFEPMNGADGAADSATRRSALSAGGAAIAG